MLDLENARQLIAHHVHLLPAEQVDLVQAHGRYLRRPLVASEDSPAFHRSAFDGYAVRASETVQSVRCSAEVAAGSGRIEIAPGECARIFTGAPIPSGAEAVAMQEDCLRDGEIVQIPAIRPGQGVRYRGEDCRAGDLLIDAGRRLDAIEVSLLAQMGETRPLVSPRPRIVHVSTGDEVVNPDQQPGPGQIRDSNSALMRALIANAGGDLTWLGRSRDSLDELVAIAGQATDGGCDLLLISGGASVGDYDFGRAALGALGFSVHFSKLNLRPGKPLIFATRGRMLAFVIPGNPLSHFVCWHVAIRAAFDCLVRGASSLPLRPFATATDLPGNARETWWPARIDVRDERLLAIPARWQSSGDLTSLAGIELLLRIPAASPGVKAGESLAALPVS